MVCRGACREKVTRCYVERLSHLAFAAPTIVEAICQGRQPAELSTETLLNRVELPLIAFARFREREPYSIRIAFSCAGHSSGRSIRLSRVTALSSAG